MQLPKVQNLRLDLLGQTIDGDLVHLELQSGNDPAMPLRMIEYGLGVQRLLGRFPRQILLYVGEAPLRMESDLSGPDLSFRYRLIDIRALDGDRLLESEDVGDNVITILAQLRDDKEAVHKIVGRIAGMTRAARETALAQLTILAGLRRLARTVEQETKTMPIDLDIRDHETIGPMIVEAEQKALQKAMEKGLQNGLQQGELTILRRQIEKRFGALPKWAGDKLAALSASPARRSERAGSGREQRGRIA